MIPEPKYRVQAKGPSGWSVRTIWDESTARGVFEKLSDNPAISECRLEYRFVFWKTIAYYKHGGEEQK